MFLPGNEVACTLRLVCRATSQQFAERAIVHPAQPVPRWCFAAECRRVCRGLTLTKRRELVRLTAASGDVANLETAVAETGCPLTAEALEAAAGAGQLLMCQWLVGPGRVTWDVESAKRTGAAAAAGGHGRIVDWCLAPAGGAPSPCCVLAAAWAAMGRGHEGLAWGLLEAHPTMPYFWLDPIMCAAEGCSLGGLQRAWKRYGPQGAASEPAALLALARAACSPTADWRDKCEFLLAQGCELGAWTSESIAGSKSLSGGAAVERLAWLQARGVGLAEGALSAAAAKGDAVVMGYLLERGLRPALSDALAAARAGHAATVRMLAEAAAHGGAEEQGWDLAQVADELAASGSLAGISWLVETHGAGAIGGLTPQLLSRACRSGSAELMAWLLAHGCGWGTEAWQAATDSGCEAALELLAERGCPKPLLSGGLYSSAVQRGDVRTMAVLRRVGVSFGPDEGRALFTKLAASTSDPEAVLRALAWLRANGCCVDWGEAERAAVGTMPGCTRTAVLTWLAEQQAPPPPQPPPQPGR